MRSLLLAAAVLALAGPARSAAIVWTGGASGDWGSAANWTPAAVPGPGDAVTIASGTVVAYSTDVSLNVASLALGAPGVTPAAVLQLSTGLAVGGTLSLENGAGLQTYSSAAISAVDVVLLPGTSIALVAAPATTSRAPFLNLSASGSFNLSGGSTITVRGRGYAGGVGAAPGSGPGAGGAGSGTFGGGGGGHAGTGGNGGAAVNGGGSYDAILSTDAGSGGGGTPSADGGSGGGAVSITASTATFDGLIDADGLDAISIGFEGAGGGAGGAVVISAAVLRGTGTISARGGSGATAATYGGGGGGGGRLWIREQNFSTLASTFSVRTTGGNFGAGGTFGGTGQIGTIFLDPLHWTGVGTDQLASNGLNWRGGAAPIDGEKLVFGASVTAKSCNWNQLVFPSSVTILPQFSSTVVLASSMTVTGDFDMASGTVTAAAGLVLRVDNALSQTGGKLDLSVATITVAAAGGAVTAGFYDAIARNVDVGGVLTATASVSGSLTISSVARVNALATLNLTTGTLTLNGQGPFTGTGLIAASTGHWTVAGGASAQTWTKINGNLGSLRVSNATAGGLTLSTAAGSSFSLTGGMTVDPAAVLRASATALSVGGNWNVQGTAFMGQSTTTFTSLFNSTAVIAAGGSFENLVFGGAGLTVVLSTPVLAASTVTIAAGTLDLSIATVSVRGYWTQTGGLVLPGTGRMNFDSSVGQTVTSLAGSSFCVVASSSAGGLVVNGPLNATSHLEWHRGTLNFANRALSVGGDMLIKGGFGLTFAGSTVTFSGASTQTINFTTLDNVVVDNVNPVKLGFDSTWGNFTVNPGKFFDGGFRNLTIIGDRWTTTGATYTGLSPNHTVTWTPPSSITVSADSIVTGKLTLSIGKTAILQGGLTIDGGGHAFVPSQNSTIVNAPGGSTITFKMSTDLIPQSGANWNYAGDVANSWLVFQGTGAARGASLSTNTFGSIAVQFSSTFSVFAIPDVNLLGSLTVSTGIVRPGGGRTIAVGGDVLQTGGVIDFNTSSTGTLKLTGTSTQTLTLLPGATLWNLVSAGTGTAIAASFLRVRGDFTAAAGTFRAGTSSHSFQGNFSVNPGGYFDGMTSTVTLDGAARGLTHQPVNFLGGGQFWALNQAVSSVTFLAGATVQNLIDAVAGSTIAVAAGATLRVDDLRVGTSSSTPNLRLRSTVPGSPWFLQVVSVSSVTQAAVSDSDASGGLLVPADDGRTADLGGNVNWDFSPTVIVLLPGETYTPGVAPGKTGVPSVSTAGVPIMVDVRIVSSRFDQVSLATSVVSLTTNDPATVAPSSVALVAGATAFTLIPRGAEPSPRTTVVTVTASFASGNSNLTVVPDALAKLQVVLPGEAAAPGSPTGKGGAASARVRGIPFSATVRAVDPFWNVKSTITHTVSLSITASSATLPAPQALAGGQAVFSGIVVYDTGTFTISAADVTQPTVSPGTSAPFGVSPPSSSSPTVGGFVPDGARVATLGGGVSGVAADGSAVEFVLADIRDLDSPFYFDWNAQTFTSASPFFATTTLGSPLSASTTWFMAAADAAFVDGHRFRLTVRALNPTGLAAQATSTFTFDRGMLAFGAKDGQGAAAVLPSAAAGCEEIVSTITYVVGASGIAPGGALAVRAPAGWTLPAGTTTTYPPPLGFWHAASTSAASAGTTLAVSPSASGPVPLGPGWLLLSVATGTAQSYLTGQQITLTYRARPPMGPAGRGPQSFTMLSRGDAGGVLAPVSTAPVITLAAGTTSFLTFVDASPLSLAPLTISPTMQLVVADLCGNPKPGLSSGTVSLSASVLTGGTAVQDGTAQFFNSAGAPISSIFLSTGQAPNASPSFSVRTGTDVPNGLILRATATFAGGNFALVGVEAVRPARLRASLPAFTAVSVDTGVLTAGATAVTLSAADPAGSAAQVRFTFADPEVGWEALISTDVINLGRAVFTAAGSGDPARPITLSWDGLDRTAVPPVYLGAATYKVRLRAGGGAAVDRTLSIVVPPTAGYTGKLGARGAGARVLAVGPGAGDGRWAVASSTGYFELRGLRPGQAYQLTASTNAVALGRPIALSTTFAAGAAASPLLDLGTLSFPATSYLRVALLAPVPSPREALGGFVARDAGGAAVFSGSLRLSSAAASTDDAGPLFGRAASTWSVAAAPPGTYDVDIEIPDLGLSTRAAGVVVPASGADLTVSLAKKTNVFGFVVLPTTVTFGTFATVQAVRAGQTDALYGGVFISSIPPSSGTFSLYGLDPGTWTVIARAPGFAAASTTFLSSGAADVSGLILSPAMGARITGGVSVTGDSRLVTQCFPAAGGAPGSCPAGTFETEVEAVAVGRLDRASARVRLGGHVSFSSAAFSITGLDAGTWTLRAAVPGFGLVAEATASVAAGGTAAAGTIGLRKLDARVRFDVQVPPLAGGACRSTTSYRSLGLLFEPDNGPALVFGDGTAMAPTVTATRVQVSTVTGAFLFLNCSSVTVFSPPLPPGGARVSALFSTNGGVARARAALVDGTTSTLSLDVSGATFTVSGTLAFSGAVGFSTRTPGGAPVSVAVSSIPGILNVAPNASFCLLGSGDPRTVPALRAELLPYDSSDPPLKRSTGPASGLCSAPAPSTGTAAAAAYVASIDAAGGFSFGGVSPGLYRLRVPGELDDDPSDGLEAAETGSFVAVTTAPVSVALRLTRGRRVSGRIAAPSGLANGRPLRVSLVDAEGREARSADVSCGLDGVSYALDGVADGRYTLKVADLGEPVAWTSAPSETVVAGADLDGRDAALSPAATVRARLALARPLPDGSEEHVLVSRENAFLLPRGFTARALAVPYAAGGAVTARAAADGSVVDADGRIVIEGLAAGTYDIEFAGPDDASPGGIAFVAARVSGVAVAPGQAADLGVVPLFAGAVAAGTVTDAVTALPVAGALVSARASLRSGIEGARGPTAVADAAGRYVLRGLSPDVRWYDLTASAAGHVTKLAVSVDVSSGAARNFVLLPAAGSATGRVAAPDGSALFSSLGAGEAPGAALFLQRTGVLPSDDPLADVSLRTAPDGSFAIPSLATGSYRLVVTAAGWASLTRALVLSGATVDLGTMTLSGGGILSGRVTLPDGSPVPDDELRAVVATTPDQSEYLYGSVTRDASARAVAAYKIGGLRAGRSYRILALSAFDEAVLPPGAASVVLASTSEARALDLVVRPPAPTVSARSTRTGTRSVVEFLFSRPLRSRTASDADPSLAVATVSATGVLSGWTLSQDRRRLTVNYDSGVGESSFTLRASAPTSALDYDSSDPAARELVASATAAFFTGETRAQRLVVANAVGGTLAASGDAGRVVVPRGAFLVDASSSVTVTLRRASTAAGVSAASLAPALRAAAAALPASLPALSDFYEIELPAGTPSTLARPAQLTLVYSSAVADPSALNLYWYNPGSGQYVLQPDALGGAPAIDASARSMTVNVGHFSTFVLLNSNAGAIGGAAHSGDFEAYNFPNPFDLQLKTVTTIHGGGVQTVRGTMVRVAVPADLSGQGTLRVFDATGRLIRTIDMGVLSAGQSYYQGWDGCNDSGRDVASGLYVGQVTIGGKRRVFKMAVIK